MMKQISNLLDKLQLKRVFFSKIGIVIERATQLLNPSLMKSQRFKMGGYTSILIDCERPI